MSSENKTRLHLGPLRNMTENENKNDAKASTPAEPTEDITTAAPKDRSLPPSPTKLRISSPVPIARPPYKSQNSAASFSKKHRFRTYRLKGKYEQSWANDPRMKRTKINNYIVWALTALGFGLSALICYFQASSVKSYDYCLVLEDHFETLNTNTWNHEVQIDGFGTGSFDWTTTDEKNSYVDGEGLHIVPTLTNETTNIDNDKLYNGFTLNLTADGTCTSTSVGSCVITSNSTNGKMIPPVRSARLTTQGSKSITYGKIEVVAKLPKGDWLWPAIWLMPEDSVYGVWPKSGEIDIMESRGNEPGYPAGGRDVFSSTLHWGLDFTTDAFWRTTAGRAVRRTDYSKAYHTYGLEWTENYIYTYLDSKLVQVLFTGFKADSTLWDLGKFAGQSENNTVLANPWANSTSQRNAPFDQKFYLILNVAIGSKNGWFPDHKGGKPWLDAGASAQWDFYKDASSWLPTWGQGSSKGMTVKSVKMWQQGKCSA